MTTRTLAELLADRTGAAGISAAAAGRDLEAFELNTIDPEGWPHAAWLGPGELVVVGSSLRLATWPGSSTTGNLRRAGRALLQFVSDADPRELVKIRLQVADAGDLEVAGRRFAAFVAEVDDLRVDAVTYANVTAGLRYRLKDPDTVLDRWRQQVEALAALDPSVP
jgi:hypothetical protein